VLTGVILLDDESFEGYGDGIVPADQRAGVDLVVPVHHDRRRARLHRSVRAGEKRSSQGDDLGGRAVKLARRKRFDINAAHSNFCE
jgi:hypothetical protein